MATIVAWNDGEQAYSCLDRVGVNTSHVNICATQQAGIGVVRRAESQEKNR